MTLLLENPIFSGQAGVLILTASGAYQSQKMGLCPFNPPLNRGDFDGENFPKFILFI